MSAIANQQVAGTFRMLADLVEIKGKNICKSSIYCSADVWLRSLGQDANEIWKQWWLAGLDGVGKGT